ncbi:hypothetical protein FRB95_000478 [Tulasnella sp. JGI-2019a]|nr:hypothetical protein FRB95_000478 [Tulasnella sp. JGI-2019a]
MACSDANPSPGTHLSGTNTKWSLDLSFVHVAFNAPAIDILAYVDIDIASKGLPADQLSTPALVDIASYASTIDIRADVNINITSDGLLANRPSAMAFVNVALTASITDKDCENDITSQGPLTNQPSNLERATSLIRDTRDTNSSTILVLRVAIVLFTLAIASCIALFFVILLQNKHHYKMTTINSLESELRQRVSTEGNIWLRRDVPTGFVGTVRILRDDLVVARGASAMIDQPQSNIGSDGSSTDASASRRPNA